MSSQHEHHPDPDGRPAALVFGGIVRSFGQDFDKVFLPMIDHRAGVRIHDPDGSVREEKVICRIDTLDEVEYFRHGGILQYVLRGLLKEAA